ncbi:hypothetical protein D0862_06200 [Hortaea werneckii]|uniref:NADP-dependent oxidoreductase domain-containing protein n=1 Tax=Hortaea werneckii TaxID=91943 RepID=A0A3M7GLB2_HORWE|nr:hypothetical protein D0862_06200 [Hortaea werneckii]
MQKLRIITISSTLLLGLFTLLLHKFPNCRISAQVIFFSQEMALSDHFRLNTGAQIPGVGLGTWKSAPGEVRSAVAFALRDGYRHIDAALTFESANHCLRIYGVSALASLRSKENFLLILGKATKVKSAKASGTAVSRLWNTHHPNVQEGLQQSLDALGVDYLDLYPGAAAFSKVRPDSNIDALNETHPLLPTNPDGSRAVDRSWDMSKTWLQMEEVYKTGKARAIGVANWSVPYLEALSKSWNIVPAVNQVELHPFLPQHELKRWCKEKGILLEAYSPLGSSGAPLQSDPAIQALATKYSVQPATILISYHVNRGVVVLPKSVTEARITQNRHVIKFEEEDLVMLDSLASQEGKAKRLNTPLWGFDLGFDDWYGPVTRQ